MGVADIPSLERAFERAVQDGTFPGAVVFARNKAGTLNYAKSFGKRSVADDAKSMDLNTTMAIASATKLITSIAVLQVVEKGLISLDDNVVELIPLLGRQEVLNGNDDNGTPITKKRQNPITLRHLLTHSAGAAYSGMNPKIDAWRKSQGLSIATGGTFAERIAQPLTYEPGTSWEYGTNIDWAGKVVEVLTGLSLEDYFHKHIFEPLGITEITFWPERHPEIKSRLAQMAVRSSPDAAVVDYHGPQITDGAKECYGGHGGFAELGQYMEILHSILLDDERLLQKGTTAQMFSPQLGAQSREGLERALVQYGSMFIGEFPDTKDYDWGLGGILTGNDLPGWRKKGRLIWSGMPNVFWWIDREAGTCAVFGTQVLPPGDGKIRTLLTLLERTIYEENERSTSKL